MTKVPDIARALAAVELLIQKQEAHQEVCLNYTSHCVQAGILPTRPDDALGLSPAIELAALHAATNSLRTRAAVCDACDCVPGDPGL